MHRDTYVKYTGWIMLTRLSQIEAGILYSRLPVQKGY